MAVDGTSITFKASIKAGSVEAAALKANSLSLAPPTAAKGKALLAAGEPLLVVDGESRLGGTTTISGRCVYWCVVVCVHG